MRAVYCWAVPLILISFTLGCRQTGSPSAVAAALGQVVAGGPIVPVRDPVWNDVRAFYEQRQGAPAWVNEKGPSKAADALDVLKTARQHGLAADDYGASEIAQRIDALGQSEPDAADRARQLADLDARLTTALLAFGRDVAVGRTAPTVIDPQWKARRDVPDLAGTLARSAGGDLEKWVDTIRPQHPEYAALQIALANLEGQREKGGWSTIPGGKLDALALRTRLAASGQLGDTAAGVRAFQALHQLPATGIVDGATRAALNVSIDDRIQQVELNLERWRWMPDDLGARHLIVNIPYFHVVAREHGKPVMDIRVVVGTPANKTPIFSSAMTTVVFSPYWNIPDSIVEGETAPAVARDPAYLAKNNIEILDVSKPSAPVVDPARVNWDDAEQLKHLAFRQLPGPGNALGHVKFLFPNEHDVYLHDTPADSLFARPGRAFSHGCVRVEEPETLAKYILRGDAEWDEATMFEAMNSGVEKHVKLKESIPVHIVYFTVWVDENDGIHFQPDVYGYDAKQAAHRKPL